MSTKKASFTLANHKIASVNVTFLVLIYIFVRTILFVRIANQFADSNFTPRMHLGLLFKIYDYKFSACGCSLLKKKYFYLICY